MALAETIIEAHRIGGEGPVTAGSFVTVAVDRLYVQDGNSPTVARLFDEHGFTRVFDPERIGLFFDHSVLSADRQMTNRLREAEAFAAHFGLRRFRAGAGISHVVALEEGWYEPGSIVLGADSHTCTGGVVQCLALGMGASDVVAAMVTGTTWLRVPETVYVRISGDPHPAAGAKDVMLHILGRYGQTPFLYRSVEWCGDWCDGLSDDAAATVANMAVELGAKCAFLPPGTRTTAGLVAIEVPDGATVVDIDISGLEPHVARPHSPFDSEPLDACAGVPVGYVFVGSCANSRYDDLVELADALGDDRVHPSVDLVVTPGSAGVYRRALATGIVERLAAAGALVTPPGCGSCVGTQGIVPADGDTVMSTMNRNFLGRMGNPRADIWLSSPRVAGRTAVLGRIPTLADLVPCC